MFTPPPRLSFARRPADQEKPARHVGRASMSHTVALAEARGILDALPGPGEYTLGVLVGRFDPLHLALAIIERTGPLDTLRVATLSFNAKNLDMMTGLLDTGRTRTLTLLTSRFWAEHNPELWTRTREEMHERGQRCAAARSHVKLLAFQPVAGDKLLLEGSANLRTCSNMEQFALFSDAVAHDFRANWLDAEVSKHEAQGDEGNRAGQN